MTDCATPPPLDEAAPSGVLIATVRLLLRRFTPADLDDLCALNGDPRVVRYLTGGEPIPRETNARFLDHYIAGYDESAAFGVWATIERASGRFVGWCALWDDGGGEAELGYRLLPSAWGHGYAAEVACALLDLGFARHGLDRIFALVYEENAGSRRVAEKLGLRFVRAVRPGAEDLHQTLGIADYPARMPKHEHEYAITRAEWAQRRVALD